jgi:hypothetical protein
MKKVKRRKLGEVLCSDEFLEDILRATVLRDNILHWWHTTPGMSVILVECPLFRELQGGERIPRYTLEFRAEHLEGGEHRVWLNSATEYIAIAQ